MTELDRRADRSRPGGRDPLPGAGSGRVAGRPQGARRRPGLPPL